MPYIDPNDDVCGRHDQLRREWNSPAAVVPWRYIRTQGKSAMTRLGPFDDDPHVERRFRTGPGKDDACLSL